MSEPTIETIVAKAIYDVNPAEGLGEPFTFHEDHHMARYAQDLARKQAAAALDAIAEAGYVLEFEGFDGPADHE